MALNFFNHDNMSASSWAFSHWHLKRSKWVTALRIGHCTKSACAPAGWCRKCWSHNLQFLCVSICFILCV